MALTEQDVAAINAVTEKCTQAIRDHDPDEYLQNCTNDVVFLPPGEPDIAGSGPVRSFLEGFPTPGSVSFQYDEVEGSGDLAFARGGFLLRDDETTTTIRALLIFRKASDGSWKLARDAWHAVGQ